MQPTLQGIFSGFIQTVLCTGEGSLSDSAEAASLFGSWFKWVVIAVVAVAFLGLYIRFRIKQELTRERARNQLQNSWYEQESRVLSAQMDPHFIFNSLNTIQHFIMSNDNDRAQEYLSKFSRLLRKMLEHNSSGTITLCDEIELCRSYLEVESIRFNNVFRYNIQCDPGINQLESGIPHFLIQPLVENAIWHGLLPKEGEKRLDITVESGGPGTLKWVIEDNGVGREQVKTTDSMNERRRSLALQFIRQRLELLSSLRKQPYKLHINDIKNENGLVSGTRVVITMPVETKRKIYAESNNY